MSSAITTLINSGGPMMQHFTSPQTLTEDSISVIPAQQPATMIPVPSVTLRTLVLDLLGKHFPPLIISKKLALICNLNCSFITVTFSFSIISTRINLDSNYWSNNNRTNDNYIY